jgi:flavin reductase (DIM6/NTAB) family NADH-FMN oxidoreductase RutF
MNQTSTSLPHGINEFQFARSGPGPKLDGNAAARRRSPAALECRLVQMIQLHDLDGAKLDQYLTIGQVVGVHVDRAYLKGRALRFACNASGSARRLHRGLHGSGDRL